MFIVHSRRLIPCSAMRRRIPVKRRLTSQQAIGRLKASARAATNKGWKPSNPKQPRAASPTRRAATGSTGCCRAGCGPMRSLPDGTGRSAGSCCCGRAGGRRRLPRAPMRALPIRCSRCCRHLWYLVLFLIGAIAMRGAGCTYNDLVDEDIDNQVERTRSRPLPAGKVDTPAGLGVSRHPGAARAGGAFAVQQFRHSARHRLARRRRRLSRS